MFVSAGGDLQIVGLNPNGGKTVWHDTVSPGDITPGVSPELPVIAGDVIYLKAVGGTTELVAANPATGKVVWRSPPGQFGSWPEECPGDPANVCSTGTMVGASETLGLRFDGTSGALLPSSPAPPGVSGRELAPGLFDPGARNPEVLVAVSGQKVSWSQPLTSVFNVPGLSTDYGWNFDRITPAGEFVGSVSGAPTSQSPTEVVEDLSSAMTAGFRIDDGSTVWQDAGSQYFCSVLPCPGADTTTSSGAGTGTSHGPTVGLRLRATGTLSGTPGGGPPTASAGTKVIVEGFDPASGRTLWSFDAGSNTDLLTQKALPPRTADNVVVLPGSDGQSTALDLSDGSQRPADTGVTAWCQTSVRFHENVPYHGSNGKDINDRVGQNALFPCDLEMRAVPPPTLVPAFVGRRAEGLVAWSETGRVVAAPSA
ncbi:MAG: PQQ-like beta-propeller repeat protein [Actinomycetota bacterium]|nr:PQQ-like beta-propeller repeat protein [Actinomycetota bacterium]